MAAEPAWRAYCTISGGVPQRAESDRMAWWTIPVDEAVVIKNHADGSWVFDVYDEIALARLIFTHLRIHGEDHAHYLHIEREDGLVLAEGEILAKMLLREGREQESRRIAADA